MIGSMSWSRSLALGVVLALLLAVLALDWLALDDITTGTEPSHALEWGIVMVSLPLLALCGLGIWRLTRNAPGLR